MSVTTALCVGKICVSAASILGFAESQQPFDHLREIFEAVSSGGEAASRLHGAEVPTFRHALKSSKAIVEEAYEKSLRKAHSAGFNELVETAFANLAEVFERCLPGGQQLAKLKHDPKAIGEAIADAAVALQMEVFREGEGRKLLVALIMLAYSSLDSKPEFMAALQRVNWKELFGQLGDIRSQQLKDSAKLDNILRAIHEMSDVPLDGLRAILREMGDLAEASNAGEIIKKLTAKAEEFRALTDRLNRLSNADPEVSSLRHQAAEVLKSGRFAQADAYLAAAEARDLAGLDDLEALAKQKRLSAAESRAERAAAAMLRISPAAYREAAGHYGEAARIAAWSDTRIARNYAHMQGITLMALGDEFGRNGVLLEAIEHFRAMLAALNRDADAHAWAATRHSLGSALAVLGEREIGTAKLEEAVEAYREALKEWTQDRAPFHWAATQNRLGIALMRLGEREIGTAKLEEAVEAFREALKERTPDRAPLDWAETQNNLGGVLTALGKFEEAVDAYREALKEWTQDRAPLNWAAAQSNLGNALAGLGKWEDPGTTELEEAVEAYREALKEQTQDRVPLDWAGTQHSLGIALLWLGRQEIGPAKLEAAVKAFHEALKERTQDRVPVDWAKTQHNLGTALMKLGEREIGTAKLEEAVEAFREARKEQTRHGVPFGWAETEHNLQLCLVLLDERQKK